MTEQELVDKIIHVASGVLLGVMQGNLEQSDLYNLIALVRKYDDLKLSMLTDSQIWWLHEVFEAAADFTLTNNR